MVDFLHSVYLILDTFLTAAYQDKAETERKELQRLNDERQKELQVTILAFVIYG